MWAIIQKEFKAFFSSFIGLGVMVAFYVLLSLYVWYLTGNILEFGFAELTVFFDLNPWFFLFFIPALAMRSFAEEFELKTFDLLRTLPISMESITLGKVLGLFLVVGVVLLPTFVFVYSIGQLGNPVGNYDASLVVGGYISILLLCYSFISLSCLASALVEKQALAFVLGVFLNFVCWQVPQELTSLETISLFEHYQVISKGVLELGSIAFFIGFNLIVFALIQLRLRLKFR
ncbi:ABC transporter permease [Aquirufa sp. OSTEICH-129V]|jgi:ABC-2 type transport system permease protein|uniref:ABC transporter permease n=1 Tax=Aquirufa avitistagni TaxID=3104728 RepID=A0ABW6DDU5_9BACT